MQDTAEELSPSTKQDLSHALRREKPGCASFFPLTGALTATSVLGIEAKNFSLPRLI